MKELGAGFIMPKKTFKELKNRVGSFDKDKDELEH